MNPIRCLTFDIEEHFHESAFDSPMRRRHWNQFESRVQRTTERLLDILVKEDVRATFFVLGWVAERHPELVRRIAQMGHEVSSLGYAHELISAQTPERFREDVRKAKTVLENILAQPVLGYRAPNFTITQETSWALPILVEEVSFGRIREAIAPMRFLYEEGAEPCRTTAHSPRTKWAPSASESLSRTSKLGRGSPGPRPGKNATSSYQEE